MRCCPTRTSGPGTTSSATRGWTPTSEPAVLEGPSAALPATSATWEISSGPSSAADSEASAARLPAPAAVPSGGESLRVNLTIDFTEAAFGCEKEISLTRLESCDTCHGTGCEPGTTAEVCPDCGGSGVVRTQKRTPFGGDVHHRRVLPLPRHRKDHPSALQDLRRQRAGQKQKKITVNIPAGIDDGQAISLAGRAMRAATAAAPAT